MNRNDMSRQGLRRSTMPVWSVATILVGTFSLTCRTQTGFPSTMTALQTSTVERLADQQPGWRLATAEDHTGNPQEVRRMRDSAPGYNPYFTTTAARGAEGPFAVALVRDTTFRVLYFPMRERGYGAPVEVAKAGWLREAHLRLHADTLRIAPFRSDVIFNFVWKDSTRSFRLIEDSSRDSP